MQTPRARANEVMAGAALDNGDVDTGQRQLARQHHPSRTTPRNHNPMFGHRLPPVGITNLAPSIPEGSGLGHRIWPTSATLRHDSGLAASPPVRHILRI